MRASVVRASCLVLHTRLQMREGGVGVGWGRLKAMRERQAMLGRCAYAMVVGQIYRNKR